MSRNEANVAWYAAKSHTESLSVKPTDAEVAGSAGSIADVFMMSKNCPRQKMASNTFF